MNSWSQVPRNFESRDFLSWKHRHAVLTQIAKIALWIDAKFFKWRHQKNVLMVNSAWCWWCTECRWCCRRTRITVIHFFIFIISQNSNFFAMKYFFFEFSRGDDQLSSNELKSPTRNETLLIWWLIIPIIRVIQQLFSKRVFEEKKIEEIKKNSVSKFSSVVGFKIFSTIFFIIFLRI